VLDFKRKIEKITFSFVIAAMLVASPMLFNANSARAEPGVAVGNGEGTVLLTCSDGSQEEVSGVIPPYYSPNPKSAEALGL
jgi:hypothetical protein